MIEKLWELPDCSVCGNTRMVPFVDSVLGERSGPCKRCSTVRRRLGWLKRARLPRRFEGLEIGDLALTVTFSRGGTGGDFHGITQRTVEGALAGYRDVFLSARVPDLRTTLAATMIRDIVLRHGRRAVFASTEEILVTALEQTKYSAGQREVPLDFELIEKVDFLIVDGAHEICVQGAMTGPVRSVVNHMFKNRRYSGKRNVFLSAYPQGEVQWSRSVGFIGEIVRGAEPVEVSVRERKK